jgi:transcription antitermination factor NusG
MSWFLINTTYRKTVAAMDFYNSIGVKCYVPLYNEKLSKGQLKRKPLLNGYIFVHFQNKIDYNLVNQNPFTKDIVVYNSKPIVIPLSQMQIMINHVESIYNDSHFSDFSKGDSIIVNHGKLQGLSGTVIEIRNNKIYLNIESLSAKLEIKYS